VSRNEIAPAVGEDFDRIFDNLAQYDLGHASARIGEVIQAFNVLETNPFIGRPAADNMRELIIGRGSRGYVALYRYVAELDAVFVLAVRSQKEAGYKRE
jgi:plasmid stabilization system protein ParE